MTRRLFFAFRSFMFTGFAVMRNCNNIDETLIDFGVESSSHSCSVSVHLHWSLRYMITTAMRFFINDRLFLNLSCNAALLHDLANLTSIAKATCLPPQIEEAAKDLVDSKIRFVYVLEENVPVAQRFGIGDNWRCNNLFLKYSSALGRGRLLIITHLRDHFSANAFSIVSFQAKVKSTVGLLALKLSFCFIMSNGLLHQDCNYSQRLKSGSVYYVYNPGYPDVSNGRQHCRWISESDYRVRLTCNSFNIPWNFRCALDRLTVHVNDTVSYSYCGNETFSVESTGEFMTIELSTSFWSSGVKFLCELQAIDEIGNDNCRCGWKKPTKIVGGMETGVNEYPMMAGLVDSFQKDVYCGATIISKRHVITAAHCLTSKDMNNVGVLVGDHDLSTGADTNASRLYTVSRFYVHPFYNSVSLENDIAVVMVNSVINFSEEVGPVCLPFQHQSDSFAGSYVDLLGWGTTQFGGTKSKTLQKVTVTVITYRECRRQYPNVSYSQLCTYGEGKDACQFDSGGPDLWQNPTTRREVLVGIISSGFGCGSDKPGINTRVGTHIDWILAVTPGIDYCKSE